MTEIELLQQVGLNKYEAEAYYTLLAEGALTGYELGKRSQVPLSRSYEILERLTQKGLALVQPGDPPRYTAERPERFLGQVRATMTTTLDALTSSLMALAHTDTSGEFWVVRSRQHILARVRAMLAEGQQSIDLSIAGDVTEALSALLTSAQARDLTVRLVHTDQDTAGQETILLLVDGRKALAGMLTPQERCQAIVSSNRALLLALNAYFTHQSLIKVSSLAVTSPTITAADQLDWVAWEDRKQQRLWKLNTNNRVA